MSQELSIREQLNTAAPSQIANIPLVHDRFVQLYKTFNGRDGKAAYEAEKFHFSKTIASSEKLSKCTKLSLYGCFLDMAVNGLSFDPAMKHAYLVPFNVNAGTRDNAKWESRAQLQISGIGELALRVQQGQVKYADNPVLVYEGDLFSMGTKDNRLYLTHEAKIPRAEDAAIIACYLRITRNDDSVDYKVLTMPEIQKLRKFSKDPNSLAWTDGLPGMIQAKTIKHAFRTYPKLRSLSLTKFTQLASDTIDTEVTEETDIYAIDEGKPDARANGKTMIVADADVKEQPKSASATIPADDEFTQTEEVHESKTRVVQDDNF